MSCPITAIIITHNESENIGRCLERLRWLPKVIVIDSGSTDDTLAIASTHQNVHVIHRPFTSFADQCNFGLEQVRTEWVLSLDADYILSDGFEAAAVSAAQSGVADGFRSPFRFCVQGKRLRGSLYPPRTVLYRRAAAHYQNEGHGHRVRINGKVADLSASIDHDDRKPLSRWLASQARYAMAEAEHLLSVPAAELTRIDKLRAMAWIMPFLAPMYCIVRKGLWRDGLAGWHYTMQRWLAECIIALAIIDRRLSKPQSLS